MPRSKVENYSDRPYHVTARTVNRVPFALDLYDMWEIFSIYLYFVSFAYGLRIHSFVLMPNHFHLIVSAPNGNISAAMNYLLREVSRETGRRTGRINQVFGGRHFKCAISSYHYFMNAYKYIYRNPVRGRLVDRVEHYPFSTLRGLLGLDPLVIPIAEDTVLFTPNFDSTALTWLNRNPDFHEEAEVGRALYKQNFQLESDPITGAPNPLSTRLL